MYLYIDGLGISRLSQEHLILRAVATNLQISKYSKKAHPMCVLVVRGMM